MISWMLIMIAVSMEGDYYTWTVRGFATSQACAETGMDIADNDGDARHFVCAAVDGPPVSATE